MDYRIAGLFCPDEVSFFHSPSFKKGNFNAQNRSIRQGVYCIMDARTKIKMDKVGFSPKAWKFGCTKQTHWMVLPKLTVFPSPEKKRDMERGLIVLAISITWSKVIVLPQWQTAEKENITQIHTPRKIILILSSSIQFWVGKTIFLHKHFCHALNHFYYCTSYMYVSPFVHCIMFSL